MAMKVRSTKDTDVTNPSSHTTYSNLHSPDKDKSLRRLQQDKKRAKLYIELICTSLSFQILSNTFYHCEQALAAYIPLIAISL